MSYLVSIRVYCPCLAILFLVLLVSRPVLFKSDRILRSFTLNLCAKDCLNLNLQYFENTVLSLQIKIINFREFLKNIIWFYRW